jgi:hypothetical protein
MEVLAMEHRVVNKMKQRLLWLIALAGCCFVPISSLAISANDLHAVQYGTVFYDPNYTPGSNGGTGGGGCLTLAAPTVNDATAFGAAIDNFIKANRPDSPLIGLGSTFVSAGVQYGINPAYIVAIARNESTYGTAVPPNSFNSFGLTAAPGQPGVTIGAYTFYKFNSWAESIPHEAQYLQQSYLSQGLVTVTQVTDKYDPPTGAGNSQASTNAYIASLTQLLSQVTGAAGSAINCGGGSVVKIAQQELALHLVGTGPEQNAGPVCKYQGSACGEDWCADFVSWVFNQAGTPFTGGSNGGWRLAAAVGVADWFKQNGVWTPDGASAPPPQPGDVFYTAANGGHVGIIVAVSGNQVTTIEGNAGPSVVSITYNDYHSTGWAGWGGLK